MAGSVYSFLFLAHCAFAIKTKSKLMISLTIGALLEAIGYFTRISSIAAPYSVPLFAEQQSLIVISPVLMAATQ